MVKNLGKILLTFGLENVNIYTVSDEASSFMERWSSWFKAPVLKIGVGLPLPWVRIPPSPPGDLPK